MISLMPSDRPDLWHGAITWTDTSTGMQPWRLLPDECEHAYAPELTQRAQIPAGVRLSGRTSARTIQLAVAVDGEGGLDVCIDGGLTRRYRLHLGDNQLLIDLPAGDHELCIWLPQWGVAQLLDAAADAEVSASPPQPRWVTYGSSITMCRTADGPSQTWPALVADRLGWDLTCLGFGGQCHLDAAVVRTIATVEADVISTCLGINVHGGGSFSVRTWAGQVYELLRRLREGHPHADLVVLTPIACPDRESTPSTSGLTLGRIRDDVAGAARDLAADCAGDGGAARVHLVDGLRILSVVEAEELLPDRLHPSPDGYRLMGRRIAAAMEGLPLGVHPLSARGR